RREPHGDFQTDPRRQLRHLPCGLAELLRAGEGLHEQANAGGGAETAAGPGGVTAPLAGVWCGDSRGGAMQARARASGKAFGWVLL
ncbi:unnamed protein product, partial [Effrenium voratum]